MRSRRTVLRWIGASGLIIALYPVVTPTRASDGSWDISYLWTPEREAALDYMERVAGVLGPDVGKKLIIVQGKSGNWGVVYQRTGTDLAAAQAVAKRHDKLLRTAFGSDELLATTVNDKSYSLRFNVGYGLSDSMASAKVVFRSVARVLGPDVHRQLVIETPKEGAWQVTYKRLGDQASTSKVAAHHSKLLASRGISARAVPDQSHIAVWGSSSAESSESSRPVRVAPDPKKPAPKATTNTPKKGRAVLPSSNTGPVRNKVNSFVQNWRHKGLVAGDETTSWFVHTLHDDKTWVAINADKPLQCASMVKPLVALAFMHRVKKGELVYGPVSKARHTTMIQQSHNAHTNWVMKQVGGPAAVQKILKNHYGNIFKHTKVVEYIPKYGKTYRNKCSAQDFVRFLRALWFDELPQSKEIKRLMGLPGRDRLKTGVSVIPASVKVLNKTGTTSHACGDFGILIAAKADGTQVPYAFCGMVEKRSRSSSYTQWQSSKTKLIRGVSGVTYAALKQEYGLK